MKITLANFVLADHDVTSTPTGLEGSTVKTTSVEDFQIEEQREMQVAHFFRGKQVTPYDRGNKQTTIRFTVWREHKTLRHSEVFALEHAKKVPGSGLLKIMSRIANGVSTDRWFEATVCAVTRSGYLGVSTFHSYELIGGEVLDKNPKKA